MIGMQNKQKLSLKKSNHLFFWMHKMVNNGFLSLSRCIAIVGYAIELAHGFALRMVCQRAM
jgi:hypothetical protein